MTSDRSDSVAGQNRVLRDGTDGTRLRVAMIAACPFPSPRGTPIRIYRMAEALSRRGHDVHVITYHLGGPDANAPFEIHRIPRVPFYRYSDPGPTYRKLLFLDPLLAHVSRRILRSLPFDVIHAHHYEGLLVARSVPASIRPPIIYDAHTLLKSELPFYRLGLGRRLLRTTGGVLDRRLPGSADHVITVTTELRERLVQSGAVGPERVTVVENGVESDLFDVPAAERPERPTSELRVVFAGNLASYQGVEHLFHAFHHLVKRRTDVRLEILTNSALGSLQELAETLGILPFMDVREVGFDRLPAELRAAHITINPRIKCDGVPQKLMNYMASGRPTISFEGSAAHMRHGETGWIVPNGDVEAMADAMVHLLDHRELAERLGSAARELIEREYSWGRTAERTERVYTRVLESVRASG